MLLKELNLLCYQMKGTQKVFQLQANELCSFFYTEWKLLDHFDIRKCIVNCLMNWWWAEPLYPKRWMQKMEEPGRVSCCVTEGPLLLLDRTDTTKSVLHFETQKAWKLKCVCMHGKLTRAALFRCGLPGSVVCEAVVTGKRTVPMLLIQKCFGAQIQRLWNP